MALLSKMFKGFLLKLYFLAFLAGASVGIWYFLPYLILDLGGGLVEVGLISTVPTLAAAFNQLSVGYLLEDTRATKDLLFLGFILSSLSSLSLICASTTLMVIVMATITETFNSITIIWGVANSLYIADLTPAEMRAGIMSVYSASWYLGNILGYFTAGFFAPIHWGIVILVFAGLNLISGFFLKYSLPKPPCVKAAGYGQMILSIFKVRRLWRALKGLPSLIEEAPREFSSFCLALTTRSIGVSMVMPITSFYVAEVLRASKPVIATLSSLSTTARVLPSPLLGWMADKWGRKKVFMTGLILMMTYPFVYVSASDLALLYPAYLMMGFAWACNQATFLAWQMELAPPREGKDKLIALLGFMNYISWAVGPLTGGLIAESWGLWWAIGLASLADLIGLLLLRGVPERVSND